MKRTFPLLVIILPSLAVAGSKKPVWVERGFHPKYSEHLYFTGIGIAQFTGSKEKDVKRADMNAVAEIAKQIRVHVMQDIRDRMEHRGKEKASMDIEIKARSQVNMMLEGVKIVDRYYDKKEKTYYSFAILNRELAASSLYSDIKQLVKEINTLLKKASTQLDQGRCWSALSELASASVLREKANAKASVLRVVASTPFLKEYQTPPDIPDWTLIKSAEGKVLEKIKLEKVKGDHQEGEVGMPLKDSLVVKVYCGEKPEGGLPLSAKFVAGKGRITETTKTNSNGLAYFKVHELSGSDIEEGRIKIFLDSAGLKMVDSYQVPDYFLSVLSEGPSIYFFYRIPTKQTLSFVIYIHEENMGQPIDVPILKPLVEDALTQHNFRIVEPNLSEAEVYNLTPQEVVNLLKGTADIAIVGEVSSQFSSSVMEGFYFAKAEGVLKAIRLSDGRVIVSKSVRDKGAGNSTQMAGMNALKNVSKKLAREFSEALELTF